MAKAPRLTTSLSPETLAWLNRWGAERGIRVRSEVLRTFIAAHAEGRCADVYAMAFAAAREQVLAELRAESRRIVAEVAARLPNPAKR